MRLPRIRWFGTADQIGAAYQERVRTVVTRDNWKFNRNNLGMHELYDLNADPLERKNVAADPAQSDRVADMQRRISAWQREVGDPD